MKKYVFLFILSFFTCSLIGFAQNNEELQIYYKSDFEINQRIVISDEGLMSQLYKTYDVDEPYWKDDKFITIKENSQKDSSAYYLSDHKTLGQSGAILTHFDENISGFHPLRREVKSITELEDYKYAVLPMNLYLSENGKQQLNQLKSMADLSKEDLTEAIKFVLSYEALSLELQDAEDLKYFTIFRIAENLYHLKLYQLGYNPYNLPEEGNYLDKFFGDKDLLALFTPDTIFQLRLE